jgi:hypothetical protein
MKMPTLELLDGDGQVHAVKASAIELVMLMVITNPLSFGGWAARPRTCVIKAFQT